MGQIDESLVSVSEVKDLIEFSIGKEKSILWIKILLIPLIGSLITANFFISIVVAMLIGIEWNRYTDYNNKINKLVDLINNEETLEQ